MGWLLARRKCRWNSPWWLLLMKAESSVTRNEKMMWCSSVWASYILISMVGVFLGFPLSQKHLGKVIPGKGYLPQSNGTSGSLRRGINSMREWDTMQVNFLEKPLVPSRWEEMRVTMKSKQWRGPWLPHLLARKNMILPWWEWLQQMFTLCNLFSE